MVSRYIELINAAMGFSLILLILIAIRDFKKEFQTQDKKVRIFLILLGLGILVFSIKELYKYGFEMQINPVVAELLETLYLVFTLSAFFSLLRAKELPFPKIKV